jgi:hypothetical protein
VEFISVIDQRIHPIFATRSKLTAILKKLARVPPRGNQLKIPFKNADSPL